MFNLTTLSIYTLTLGIAAVTPGPGMTALLFKTITSQYKNGLIMLFGLITGDLCYLAIALFGLNLIETFTNNTFSIILICCACSYLYYIALKLWLQKEDLLISSETSNSGKGHNFFFSNYLNGLSLTLSNPKTITFYLALVPTIFGSNLAISPSSFFVIVTLTIIILLFVGGLYIFSAYKIRNFLSKKKNQHIFLKSISVLMASLATHIMVNQVISYI